MKQIETINEIGVGPAVLGRVMHRVALTPPAGFDRLRVSTNQAMFERGWSPPWVWSDWRCRDYWSTRTSDTPENNLSEITAKPVGIVDAMADFWAPDVSSSDSVFEVGCSAGPNLERLRQLGYSKLSGVEINNEALKEMQAVFPELAQIAKIEYCSAEEMLPRLDSNSIDVVFGMAVLHHIHPASNLIFAQMVRLARRFVCVIEPEVVTLPYIFARNYGRVFERLGCTMVRELEIVPARMTDVDAYEGYVARLFRVPAS